jgi:DNA-binding XRE family transcriptional regulator
MNKKHIGGSFFDDVKKWEERDPDFRRRVNEAVEKRKLAAMLKEIRKKEHLTQEELAQKANVTQSVIARIEGGTAKGLPRFDVFNRIVAAAGYEMSILAKKKGKRIQVAFSG